MKVEWVSQDGARIWRSQDMTHDEWEGYLRVSITEPEMFSIRAKQFRTEAIVDLMQSAVKELEDRMNNSLREAAFR